MSGSSAPQQRTPWLDLRHTIRRVNGIARLRLAELQEQAARERAAADTASKVFFACQDLLPVPLNNTEPEDLSSDDGLEPVWFDDPSFDDLAIALHGYGLEGEAEVLKTLLHRARSPQSASHLKLATDIHEHDQAELQVLREIVQLTDQWMELSVSPVGEAVVTRPNGPPADLLTTNELVDDARLSPSDIAKRFPQLTVDAVSQRLNRWRSNNSEGWHEVTDRKPREARYLYRWGEVKHLFEPLGESSGERRAK